MPRSNKPRRRHVTTGRGGAAAKWSRDTPDLDMNRARMGVPARENAPDGLWTVRSISAGNALKVYTCPGCNHAIDPGVAHLVVWREDAMFGNEAGLRERRHWHNYCWRGRSYRYR